MSRMPLGMMLAAAMGLGGWWTPMMQGPAGGVQDSTSIGGSSAPAPWIPGDPADSLYRAAREALDRRDYRRAADLFGEISTKYASSGYAADAFYWRAFALYRLGSTSQLREGLQALATQRQRFPQAATRGDAAALERRIQGELGRRGDPQAAALVDSAAQAAALPPTPPIPPRSPTAPTPPIAPTPPVPPTPPTPPDDRTARTKRTTPSSPRSMRCSRWTTQRLVRFSRRSWRDAMQDRSVSGEKRYFSSRRRAPSGAEDILLETARTDPDHEVREQSVFWLSQVGTDRAVGALDSILADFEGRSLQEKALFALSQHDSPRAQQSLRGYAERGDLPEETREKAIFWIGQQGGKENDAFLRALYGRLKEVDLREKVLFSISQSGGNDNVHWLLGIAKDGAQPAELRKKALFWAGQATHRSRTSPRCTARCRIARCASS